jgi:hypothetical protein
MRQALTVRPSLPAIPPTPSDFSFHGFRIFTSVPDHPDYGTVALHGMVVIYDERPIHMEGLVEGSFYVRESQHPVAAMAWESWLKSEWEDRARRGQPRSPLKTRREVVQAMRWPYADNWSVRLSSGFVDGPYHDWAFGYDFVGKVVGIYRPRPTSSDGAQP